MTAFPANCSFPARVVALDVGATKIAGALVTYADAASAPTVEARRTVPTEARQGGEAVLERVCSLAAELAAEAGTGLLGVGVGTAGRVNAATGSIAYANDLMPGWTGRPVAEALQNRCGCPAAVLNDVQAYGVGEARWGVAKGADTCVLIAVGTGVGGAIIVHGRVVRGKHGFAGEVGHLPSAAATGIPCACGGTGHLESVAAGSGIEARYFELAEEHVPGAEVARRAAEENELFARRVIKQAGHALGEAIAGLTNVLDPDMVVLSGSVTNAGNEWRAEVKAGFASQIPEAQRDLPIVDAALGADAPLVGAAEHLIDSLQG